MTSKTIESMSSRHSPDEFLRRTSSRGMIRRRDANSPCRGGEKTLGVKEFQGGGMQR